VGKLALCYQYLEPQSFAPGHELAHDGPDRPEQAFKRILGGATSVLEGLGSLRNKIGDGGGWALRSQ
jgi:Abortive infection C-terminus